jgi:FkbM family methyltransferase
MIACVRGHHFLTSRLDASATVVDLGAHRGEFSAGIARRFGCHCLALEPVAELLAATGGDPRIRVLHAAIAAVDGPVALHLKRNPEASTLVAGSAGEDAGERAVAGTTWSSLRQRAGLGQVALLKIDVEGAEVDLLRAMSPADLQAIEQLAVEFHPDVTGMGPIREVVARLGALGFWTVRFSRGYGDVLFVNQAVFALGLPRRLWLRHVVRNWLGIQRILRRWAGRAP